ncbi:FlgO family outer membrane protein [Spongiivirga sp. MCCC 1A20706]|uniref:adenylate/guanylate cyclase domain-containing protein n=1 Tax=Spongiivirga sp. MCCC 1A20706 TaxID=3160963 RepID=UPI00397736A8
MSQHRQLAAIMFTDIEGYTSIMQQDELEAIAVRNKHRDIFNSNTEKYNGKIIQYFGDGTLSIFKSSVEAVECAIQLQKAFISDPTIPVRIGIHVGDIVYSKDDIIGDAVNVASRIESCAISGSILISDKVNDQLRSHRHIKTEFLDAYELKNVEDTVPIFAIAGEGLKIPKPEQVRGKLKQTIQPKKSTFSLKKIAIAALILISLILVAHNAELFTAKITFTDKSIAVLPFTNFSKDSESDILSDGVTEDILSQLSKLKDLHVISRTSVTQYKNTKKNIRDIAKELDVTFILEGSIQKNGDQVRITAQLIDTKNDKHIWAEKYDLTLTNIFTIQSEVSEEIVKALDLNLTSDKQKEIARIPTRNIAAYKLFLKGKREADKRNNESIEASIKLYKEVIALDPNYAEAYAEIANSIFLQTYYGNANPNTAAKTAEQYLERAEKINSSISRVYTVKGLLYNHTKQFKKAKAAFEKAIELSPNDVTARHQFATFFYYTEDYEKQLEQTKIAYSLDPLSFATASSYFTALTSNNRFDEAEALIEEIKTNNKESDPFVINRLYMRLYMAKPDFKKAIEPLKYLSSKDWAYYRFLGYSYGRLKDTSNAYRIIDSIKDLDITRMKNHRVAVVFAGLDINDSIFYYLDTARNKSKLFNNKRIYYFDDFKKTSFYTKLLAQHRIQNHLQE